MGGADYLNVRKVNDMSKFTKTIALFLMTVMTMSFVPVTVFAGDIDQAEAENAILADEEDAAGNAEQGEPSEDPAEKPTEKPADKPDEDIEKETGKETEAPPAGNSGEDASNTPQEEPAKPQEEKTEDKTEEESSDNGNKTSSVNDEGKPSGDTAGNTSKQEAEPVDPVDSIPVVEGTWDTVGGKKIFLDGSGTRVTGFCRIGEKIYFFDKEGIMKTGWLLLSDGTRRFFNPDGTCVAGSWKTISKAKYYFDENGVMATGLKTIGEKYYFFDSTGKMKKGWVTTGGKKYYFDKKSGSAYVNRWFKYKKKKYHFDSEGVMAKGLTYIGGKLYFFNSKGQMKKGWVTTGGKKYYFDKKGRAYVNRWLKKKKKKYHFDSEGVMAKGLTYIGSNLYFFNSKGRMKKGWVTTGGNKYYFDKKGKAYINKWLKYKKKKYYFDSEGVMSKGLVVIGGQTYCFDSAGKLKTGWVTIHGVRYYFDKNGKPYVNKWLTYNKHKYYFNSDGIPVTDLQKIGNHLYYFDSNGMMKTGWMTIDGERYYFLSSGAAAAGGWYWIGEDRYYFGTEGNMYYDTVVEGIVIGPDGVAIIEEDEDDYEDEEERPLINRLISVGTLRKNANATNSSICVISTHVLGYPDPGYRSGSVTVSGWTYVLYYDNSKNEPHILKAEEFDVNKFNNGGYDCDIVNLCNLPGEKITMTIKPSEEFCDFLGWSRNNSNDDKLYNADKILSTDKTITVTVASGEYYCAHCNSPWNACYVDITRSNGGKRKFTVHHLMCHRNENGIWVMDTESIRLIANVAFYHSIYSNYGGPVMNSRTCYGFFMRDENTKFSTEGVYVTILKDERGRETGAKQYIHTWKYDLSQNPGSDIFALMDEDGKIILKIEFYDENTFHHVDPVTGEWLDVFEDPELLKYVDS